VRREEGRRRKEEGERRKEEGGRRKGGGMKNVECRTENGRTEKVDRALLVTA
jgi:hypothetical protein